MEYHGVHYKNKRAKFSDNWHGLVQGLNFIFFENFFYLITSNNILKKIGPDFTLFVEFYGMELAVKEKLASVTPNAKFTLWATGELSMKDMTDRAQSHVLQETANAPKIPRIFGTFDCRLAGSIPVFDDVVHEGKHLLISTRGAHELYLQKYEILILLPQDRRKISKTFLNSPRQLRIGSQLYAGDCTLGAC